ncbi:hypothetical protein BDV32DRAFT_34130 [Aspergillus pseudonomiae]|uniref:Uncharacterized protein n=1 Tax=Aspergillus pseudonomiae TaxID=1506151 RepID=A0A5N7DHG5_9EURO|nr:uncharacterized protein BDV37DRAFT_85878 [Aspergillus pseudonomiae]KAB8265607.1 hypothetical protein BDV32DRAFT_34130 [Aspergillus pseudonomiae]KAE8405655.1 hypothetical protein BDV37DRAFT_85878 [Aspergillus pseudonomiae]
MSSDKPEVTEVGMVASPAATKPSFKSRVAAHFKKWWWAHLIAFIVVVLVVALPVVYVGYPNIAQDNINDSKLEVKSMVISEPTPESFHVDQQQVIWTDSVFHPTIYSFNASVGLLGAAPFGIATIPQLKSRDGVEVRVDQRLDLTDASAFGDFATAVMQNEYVDLNVYGRPDLKQGALPKITVTYNHTATMKGLNKLKGFSLSGMKLAKEAPDGTNTEGQVLIPNPSVMTISLGNVTLDLSVNGTGIGTSYIQDLVLKPGDNKFPMRAKVDQLSMVTLMTKYPGTVVPVDITGSATNSSVYDGKALSYFSRALASNKLQVNLNITEVVGSSLSKL